MAAGITLPKGLTIAVDNGRIEWVIYPVFPPDRNAASLLAQLSACRKTSQWRL
jgi:peroxiredoxin (alkyl hydroperoxide reductase subunit C)